MNDGVNRPERVLHVLGRLDTGGAESRIMDMYRALDREALQFDFVIHTEDRCFFESEIEALGGKVYRVPRYKGTNNISYKMAWSRVLDSIISEQGMPLALHAHMTSTASLYIPIAVRKGIRPVIAHARNAGTASGAKGMLTRFLRRNLLEMSDLAMAVSTEAGRDVFGERWMNSPKKYILPNGIFPDKFLFDPDVRKEVRKELGIDDSTVCIGHIGRFEPQKNHGFLLDIFISLNDGEAGTDFRLLMLGEGYLQPELKARAGELGILEKCIFAGVKSEVWRYYAAMDIFLLPSLYEGLPGVVLEAQASGLKCIISDTITGECCITDLVETLPLDGGSVVWRDGVIRAVSECIPDEDMCLKRRTYPEKVRAAGFDVRQQVETINKIYHGDLQKH